MNKRKSLRDTWFDDKTVYFNFHLYLQQCLKGCLHYSQTYIIILYYIIVLH